MLFSCIEKEFVTLKKSNIKAGEGKLVGNFPFFTSSDTKRLFLETYLIEDEAIILGTGGMPSCNYFNGKFSYSTDNIVLKSRGKIKTKWLYYFLRANNLSILEMGFHGAGLKHISKDYINKIVFPVYDSKIQEQQIAELDIIYNNIIKYNQTLDLLNELIKSRFTEMFSDCDNIVKLEELSELITKGASPKWQGINYVDEGVLFVTSENVREGFIDISNPKYLEEKVNYKQPRSILKRGDILINIVGASIGRAAIYNYDYLANINQAVSLVRPNEKVNIKYLITFLNSENAMTQYRNNAKGGARDNLSLKNISDLMIPVPDLKSQNEFAQFVEQIIKSKFNIQKQISYLNELLDKKMNEYFNIH